MLRQKDTQIYEPQFDFAWNSAVIVLGQEPALFFSKRLQKNCSAI